MPVALAFLVVVLVLPSAALAQSGAQITISQPAEATTMDPGRKLSSRMRQSASEICESPS